MKRLFTAALALTLILGLFTACGQNETMDASEITPDTVVAKIGDQEIYVYEMDYLMSMGATKEEALDELVNFKAMQQKAIDEGVSLDDSELEELLAQKEQMVAQYGGEEPTNAIFKQYGLTSEQYDKINEMSALVSKFSNKLEELGLLVPATDADAKEFYNLQYLRAKHILFATQDSSTGEAYDDAKKEEVRQTAQETLDKIKAGEDFDSFMDLSEDPGSAQNPDGYLFINTDEYKDNDVMMSGLSQMGVVMVEPFETATKNLNVGEVSQELVESDFGYHIIKRLDINEKDSLFTDIADQIKTIIDNIHYIELTEEWENSYKLKREDAVFNALDQHFTSVQEEAKNYEEAAQQAMLNAQSAMMQQMQPSASPSPDAQSTEGTESTETPAAE